jgi:hypothetical protein
MSRKIDQKMIDDIKADAVKTFKRGESSNPHKECSEKYNIWRAAWIQAKEDFYKNA